MFCNVTIKYLLKIYSKEIFLRAEHKKQRTREKKILFENFCPPTQRIFFVSFITHRHIGDTCKMFFSPHFFLFNYNLLFFFFFFISYFIRIVVSCFFILNLVLSNKDASPQYNTLDDDHFVFFFFKFATK